MGWKLPMALFSVPTYLPSLTAPHIARLTHLGNPDKHAASRWSKTDEVLPGSVSDLLLAHLFSNAMDDSTSSVFALS